MTINDYLIIALAGLAIIAIHFLTRLIYLNKLKSVEINNFNIDKKLAQLISDNLISHVKKSNAKRIDIYFHEDKEVIIHINNSPAMTFPLKSMNNLLLALPNILSITACSISIHKNEN
jgi:hypothetical protein